MNEKNIPYNLSLEKPWEKREQFVKLNKSGAVPFLLQRSDDDGSNVYISGVNAICEYLEEHDAKQMIFGTPVEKAEIRRMIDWVNIKMYSEATELILNEKVIDFFRSSKLPNQEIINVATKNLLVHIDYFGYLISRRGWLAGYKISLADIALAAHISCLDYLGVINWIKLNSPNKESFKEWYRLVKSRPCFKEILNDSIVGFDAAESYRELDFF